MRPKTKKKDPLEDAVGTPKSAKKTNKAFTRKPRAAKAASPVSKAKVDGTIPEPKLDSTPMTFRNGVRFCKGVVIPDFPHELRDPKLNERTPAVMQWYRDNHPKAFDALYSGRTIED